MPIRFERYKPTEVAATFDSGEPEIDDFLRKAEADEYERQRCGHTYLVYDGAECVSFVTLAASALKWPARATRLQVGGVTTASLPAILIGQLATRTQHQGKGYGKAVITVVANYARRPTRTLGVRLLLVHSLNKPKPRALYNSCGFRPVPYEGVDKMNPIPLYLDLAAIPD